MARSTRRYQSHVSLQQTIKDYFVPILGLFIIVLVLWNLFAGEDKSATISTQSGASFGADLSFIDENTEAYIVYNQNKKEKITDSIDFFTGESLQIKEGSVKIDFPQMSKVHLNTIGELKYVSPDTLALLSSEAWIESRDDMKVQMRYANIEIKKDSIISMTQNEAGSTLYVIKGSAKVENLAKNSTQISAGQKITVTRLDTSKTDDDISEDKLPIDAYFKSSDWFIENEGHLLVAEMEKEQNGSGTLDSTQTGSSYSGAYVILQGISDEMNVKSGTLSFGGKLLNNMISSVTVNNKSTLIDSGNFSVSNVALENTVNDIVLKYYDSSKNIIGKEVITIYTSQPEEKTPSNSEVSPEPKDTNSNTSTSTTVNPDQFSFTEPSTSGKYTTAGSEITIRGKTTASNITKVQVNGFPLSSFNGNSWRYHAFTRFDTLKEGTNQYRVDYFGENGKLVYTDYFTIIKEGKIGISSASGSSEGRLFTE